MKAKFLVGLDFAMSEGFLGFCHLKQILLESSNFKIDECKDPQKMVHNGRWPPSAATPFVEAAKGRHHFLRTLALVDFEIRGFQ